jgi:hypothetical protein
MSNAESKSRRRREMECGIRKTGNGGEIFGLTGVNGNPEICHALAPGLRQIGGRADIVYLRFFPL